ncbi:MAG: ImmA/IrrE family metallo-endopeptidase [Thermodesulfobacteriota bacterium]
MGFKGFKCEWIKKSYLWTLADEKRLIYWPENKPPINMEDIIDLRLKLDIEPMHGLLKLIDTDAWIKIDLSGIVVDYDCYINDRYTNRLRFSLAHEIAHFFLHKDIYSGLQFSSLNEWKIFMNDVSEDEYRNFEWQANEFAGRFLVPREELKSRIDQAIELIENDSELIEYLKLDPDAVLSRMSPFIRKPFGVSDQVILFRVQSEKLWPPEI